MNQNNYLSIKEISNHLFKIRYTLILLIIIGVIGGLYLIYNNEIKWRATIKLESIDNITLQKYNYLQEINGSVIRSLNSVGRNLLAFSDYEDSTFNNNIISNSSSNNFIDPPKLNKFVDQYDQKLLLLITDKASNQNLIFKVLDEIKIIDKSEFSSIDTYNKQLKNIAAKFRVSQPIITPENKAIFKRDYNPFWEVSFVSNDKTKTKETIMEVLSQANLEVQTFMQNGVEEYLELLKIPYEENISMLESRMKLLINQYDLSRENTIAFLEEQARLARSIGYEKSAEDDQNIAINILPNTSFRRDGGGDYYMKGYEFIETQIDLLNDRHLDSKKYIPELIQSESLIIALTDLRNDNVKRLHNAFRTTPLYEDDFISAKYNETKISYEKVGITSLVLFILSLLVSLIGCILIFIFSLTLNIYREKIRN